MSQFWSQIVHKLDPYVPGEQPQIDKLIKLNTNENPYPPSPLALAAIQKATNDKLRLYPDPASLELRQVIAADFDLTTDNVFIGNGSDEVLAHAFMGLLKHDQPLLFPDITYSFYPVYCGLYAITPRKIPLRAGMRLDIDDYIGDCGAIIFPNPNAPTGTAISTGEIARLLKAQPNKLVVIDEAYVDFGAETAVPLIAEFPNLLVIRTFSKSYSLAGLRIGFAVGQRHLIEALERVKDSFNSYPLDRLALAAGTAAWQDKDWLAETRGKIIANRVRLTSGLETLGFEVLPSAANFLFARHPDHQGKALASALRERAILVRHFDKPRISDYLRITIGTDVECDQLLETLEALID